jgi:hypothetical protein
MRFYPKNIFIMMQKSSKITALAFSMWSEIKLSNQQIWKTPTKKLVDISCDKKVEKREATPNIFFWLSLYIINMNDNFAKANYIKIEWKSKKVQILELSFCCSLSFEIISETVRERGNLSFEKPPQKN